MPVSSFSAFARRFSVLAAAAMSISVLAGCANRETVLLIQRDLTDREPEQALQRLEKIPDPDLRRSLFAPAMQRRPLQ